MRNYRKVDITVELLRQIGATNGAGLLIRDLLQPGYYWKVFQEYRVGTRHGDVLRWEKWHVFSDKPVAPPEITPIDTTGGVLLKQGRSAQLVKYRPKLNAAMNAAGVFQFYTAPPPEVYTDVPAQVLVYMPGLAEATEINVAFGGVVPIPSGAHRVIVNRHELDGSTCTVVFASGYHDFVEYLGELLVKKQQAGWEPDELNKRTIQWFLEKKGGEL